MTTERAGWFLDPEDRQMVRFRYWDGAAWTDRVSDDGASVGHAVMVSPDRMAQHPPVPSNSLASALARAGAVDRQAFEADQRHMSWMRRILLILSGVGFFVTHVRFVDFERRQPWSLVATIVVLLFSGAIVLLGMVVPQWHRRASVTIGGLLVVVFLFDSLALLISSAYGAVGFGSWAVAATACAMAICLAALPRRRVYTP